MDPVTPVVQGWEQFEVIYAKDQPEYSPLPAIRTENVLMSRWRLTDEERKMIAEGHDLFVYVMHFGMPLQPILPFVATDQEALEILVQSNPVKD